MVFQSWNRKNGYGKNMEIAGVKLTQNWPGLNFSSILMVPTPSYCSTGIFPFVLSHCLVDSYSICCFGVVGTLSGNGFQGFLGKLVKTFCFKWFIFLMFWILSGRSSPNIFSKTGGTFFFNCYYVLSRLFPSTKLSWCVNLLLVGAGNAMISLATFISDTQSLPEKSLSLLHFSNG